MRRIALAILATGLATAAPAARADDASRLAVARQVVEAAHAADNMRVVMPVMMNQMRTLLVQQAPSDPKGVETYLQRFQAKFEAGVPDFVDLVAAVYAREFTESDLSDLLGFYRTPAGQHLLAKQPEIAKGMLLVGQQWGESIARGVLADMQREKQAAPAPKL